jgi:hypothetical protein
MESGRKERRVEGAEVAGMGRRLRIVRSSNAEGSHLGQIIISASLVTTCLCPSARPPHGLFFSLCHFAPILPLSSPHIRAIPSREPLKRVPASRPGHRPIRRFAVRWRILPTLRFSWRRKAKISEDPLDNPQETNRKNVCTRQGGMLKQVKMVTGMRLDETETQNAAV